MKQIQLSLTLFELLGFTEHTFVILDNRYHRAGYLLAQLTLGLVIQLWNHE